MLVEVLLQVEWSEDKRVELIHTWWVAVILGVRKDDDVYSKSALEKGQFHGSQSLLAAVSFIPRCDQHSSMSQVINWRPPQATKNDG